MPSIAVPPAISAAKIPVGKADFERRAMNRSSPTVGSADAKVPIYRVLMPERTI